MESFLLRLSRLVWGVPTIALILGTGLLLTLRLRCIQLRRLGDALRLSAHGGDSGEGEVSGFAAMCTSLSATLGTGNIVGVATAIAAGGPGALLWMLLAGFLGMATKYAEGFLAVRYRLCSGGRLLGGPFAYIELGMGRRWRPLAQAFALFGALAALLGIGTLTQVNSISSAVGGFFDPAGAHTVAVLGAQVPAAVAAAGLLTTLFAALFICGGIRRISGVSTVLVPFMAGAYLLCGLLILVCNLDRLPGAVSEILRGALGFDAAAGGALGSAIAAAQNGVARGIFCNEAGLGSSPIAAAASRAREPVEQGLRSMTCTFIDTMVLCTVTGLCVVVCGVARPEAGLVGSAITEAAFTRGLPLPESLSRFLLTVCLVFFAFTSIIGWCFYGERCTQYLAGVRAVKLYRALYIVAVFVGPYLSATAVWTAADILNAMMALPNICALWALSGQVRRGTLYPDTVQNE